MSYQLKCLLKQLIQPCIWNYKTYVIYFEDIDFKLAMLSVVCELILNLESWPVSLSSLHALCIEKCSTLPVQVNRYLSLCCFLLIHLVNICDHFKPLTNDLWKWSRSFLFSFKCSKISFLVISDLKKNMAPEYWPTFTGEWWLKTGTTKHCQPLSFLEGYSFSWALYTFSVHTMLFLWLSIVFHRSWSKYWV